MIFLFKVIQENFINFCQKLVWYGLQFQLQDAPVRRLPSGSRVPWVPGCGRQLGICRWVHSHADHGQEKQEVFHSKSILEVSKRIIRVEYEEREKLNFFLSLFRLILFGTICNATHRSHGVVWNGEKSATQMWGFHFTNIASIWLNMSQVEMEKLHWRDKH